MATGPQLTVKQRKLVAELARPDNSSIQQAAQRAGVHRVSAGRMLRKAEVREAVEQRTERERDKARGLLGELSRVKRRAVRLVARAVDAEQLSAGEALLVARTASEVERGELQLREILGDQSVAPVELRAYQRRLRAAFRLGRMVGRAQLRSELQGSGQDDD